MRSISRGSAFGVARGSKPRWRNRLPTSSAAVAPCPDVPIPMGRRCGTDGKSPVEGQSGQIAPRFSFPTPSGRLYLPPCAFPVRKLPCPEASYPPACRPHPRRLPGLGMGPRDQARRIPADCSKGWQAGPAIHPTRLRLERQVSLDSRVPTVPPGPLHCRGRGSGLGWDGRQVGLRQAAFLRARWRGVPVCVRPARIE